MRLLSTLFAFCSLMVISHNACAHSASSLPIVKPVMACSQLVDQALPGVEAKVSLTSAKVITSGNQTFCQVKAVLSPEIGVEVALPQQQWTQRILQVGCGGLCGSINLSLSNANGCVPATRGEFVVAATNMGHAGSMMDASWALTPQKRIDFAYRANHLTAQFTKALTRVYYGQPQKYAYFMGCSDGGREALMEAQRYPDDFNGISAGAPAAYFTVQNSFYHGWNVVANQRADGSAILLKNRLTLLHQIVLAHCPTASGVNDGVLANPFACHFSKNWLNTCSTSATDKSACFTEEEIGVIDKLYQGARDAAGHQFAVGGLIIGSELRWPLPETAQGASSSAMMALPALQYVLTADGKKSDITLARFGFDQAHFQQLKTLAPLYNATDANLKPFAAAGGKLILWHGLADDSINPTGTLAYYREVVQQLGAQRAAQMSKLFLLPGVGHCGGGEGNDQIDLLTPLMAWVEHQQAPQKLLTGKAKAEAAPQALPAAEKPQNAEQAASVQMHGMQRPSSPVAPAAEAMRATRPVYAYPYIAVYNGKGDPLQAKNYHAVLGNYPSVLMGEPIRQLITSNTPSQNSP
ncbi:tannase/feruloyl esterase family alpha/beta hydrolase [Rosenbergiella epipactidis]|uniref:tannase/feruloyl esterase family alpha/beta hydrolase n=1 Tax=Rosenbergiella epipactidis TaxID=1544694 RepID=UPI001F4EFB64|nr:tannase/feruloyl esterase family alpha/beta hydrolase [Rosenbergiella epipactidis]